MVRGQLRTFVNVVLTSKLELSMLLRVTLACALVLGAGSAYAEDLNPEQARAFVVGKLFSYTCFDGTVGVGRIFGDGSVVGTIRPMGQGPVRFAALPAGTIRVSSTSMCAHLSGIPFEPCFRVQKTDSRSFRGSLAALSFAYCDFTQHNPRTRLTSNDTEPQISAATPIPPRPFSRAPAAAPAAVTPVPTTPVVSAPISTALRPAIEE
jgi:hypothetical protein